MKKGVVLGSVLLGIGSAAALAQQAAVAPGTAAIDEARCVVQHEATPGISAAGLLTEDYQIKSAVPGGLWLQKNKDVFYCNSGVVADGDTMCWKLVRPSGTASCSEVNRRASARHTGS